jgi:hypothetical protein
MNPGEHMTCDKTHGDDLAATIRHDLEVCGLAPEMTARYDAERGRVCLVWRGADPDDTLGVPAEGGWVERLRRALPVYAVARPRPA